MHPEVSFEKIRVVLVAPSHPGNIGATARAMKTMGLNRLYLVNPKCFPHQNAHEMAAGADDILTQAVLCGSLKEALADCHLVLGTSARIRDLALNELTPKQSAVLIATQSAPIETAVVFGREHAGLTNEELLHCHHQIHIPTSEHYHSLNLAQAVQIIAYEIRMEIMKPCAKLKVKGESLAQVREVEQFYEHLQTTLTQLQFLKPSNPKKLMHRLRRLFNRSQLEEKEVNILRGILTSVEQALDR